jgi:bla regulator protein BlaR1
MPIVIGVFGLSAMRAQDVPDWQTKAGGKTAFDVASIKPIQIPRRPSFGLGPDDAKPRGGRFSATFPLKTFIAFAYKLEPFQMADAFANTPKWLSTGFYDIEAEAQGNPTKDQMRLMMQSLLADRLKLAVHFETKELPVLALTEVKAGKPGPKLLPHSQGPPCSDEYKGPEPGVMPNPRKDVFPPNCGAGQGRGMPDGTWFVGSRDTTMAAAAATFYGYGSMAGEIDRPVVDQTGLEGTFDFVLEYKPVNNNGIPAAVGQAPDAPPGAAAPSGDFGGTPFVEALRQQLGLKLVRTKAPVRVLVIDHFEKPSEN